MDDLIDFGTISAKAAQFLADCVKGKLNVLISGGTGTGKTTTLNALSAFVPGRRAHRHDRGRGRAPAAAGPRDHARGAAAEHRGPGRGPDPRARPQRPAHAARPDHRRRGPRRRDPGHAPGDEHGPRGLAHDDPRQLPARRAVAARDARPDGRRRPAAAGDPRADRECVRPARPDHAPRRRIAPHHAHHRGAAHGVGRDHAAGHLPRQAAGRGHGDRIRTATGCCTPLACTGLKPHFLEKMAASGVVLPPRFFHEEEGYRPNFAASQYGGFQ